MILLVYAVYKTFELIAYAVFFLICFALLAVYAVGAAIFLGVRAFVRGVRNASAKPVVPRTHAQ